ncbi:MAG TPA: bacillithiol transferase BstA [Terracidiphilus sp.]|jgi:hypothetical protein|nr:bacillithiol transferase BstA [Terracidiphilus sp.]
MTDLDELRYPIGRFHPAAAGSRAEQIQALRELPERLREAVGGLNQTQLDTPYRDGGWTSRQLVHHVADSHANAYIRFKLALTEDNPLVKAYDEAAWAKLADSRMPVDVSLALTAAVHARLVALIEAMAEADFEKTFRHPEHGAMSLGTNLGLYAWHSRHHTAHITRLRERMGW